jgi:catechol-2,3-dioxygenase
MIALARLDHLGLEVRDLAAAEAFYTGVLGLRVSRRLGDQIILDVGDLPIALFERKDLPPPDLSRVEQPLGKGHHAFLVNATDFEAARRIFREAGIPHKGPVDWGDHDCLYFLDPDGHLLELIAYREEATDVRPRSLDVRREIAQVGRSAARLLAIEYFMRQYPTLTEGLSRLLERYEAERSLRRPS